ncbi:response regulator transcription factor [Acinetobacter seifertii]|uniref:LytTR family DNA-binding domain-containing protein n=2 Tax=Acinetobacter TaxID=469 RepID=A0A5E9PCZ9_9GAMM|nr:MULTISPECIES: LytTR family DNA-binding domain-containing protein [Acinetobacter]KHO14650.1 chemotaxis protein CheY [Acinetobacter baumannii]MBJ8504588.1 response regulator transcription factor [Acinetobacter seifertii]MBZ6535141.1 response regulator transcription factor [Acinetobacter seifertii]MCG8286338.1 LytTR family DNA-binding domain-containing protein [Acinetobacter seifertii]MCH2003601.1 LytTR family DNA-binding domain-containing protein [Acinetobacter seifertii]
MKVLICDDEPLAVERLSRLVSKMGHEVVATAHHGQDALEQARLHQPDVILLDIQMPGMNGLVCAEQLSQLNPRPAIVFCTAYDQHALEAFKSQAQAYLLKPIDPAELEQALKQLTQLTQAQLNALPNPELLQDLKTQRHQIAAKTYRGVELIPVENIYYFLADQKYVTIRHKNGSVLIDETLKELETEFADQFIRIHRNALVSIAYLDGLELVSSGQYQVRLRGLDERLSVSRRHLSTLRERIHQL